MSKRVRTISAKEKQQLEEEEKNGSDEIPTSAPTSTPPSASPEPPSAAAAGSGGSTPAANGGAAGHKQRVFIATHPVILHKLTQLRRAETSSKHFREMVREISSFLAFEATRDLNVASNITVRTPSGAVCYGQGIATKIALVPVLRSGLGMTEAVLDVIPMSPVHHIGIFKNPESLLPVVYFNKLTSHCDCDLALVMDPQIGTGSSLTAVLDLVKEWAASAPGKTVRIKVLSLIASRPGLDKVRSIHPDVDFHLAAIDEGLDESGMPSPGMGDPGQRLFNAA